MIGSLVTYTRRYCFVYTFTDSSATEFTYHSVSLLPESVYEITSVNSYLSVKRHFVHGGCGVHE